jgi:Family of unknown function (DUF6518)
VATGERAGVRRSRLAIGLLPLAAAFGAADQYLGTSHLPGGYHPVTTAISGMSAPWLVLAFCFGCTQVRPRPAVLIGLAATLAGLAGYFAMMWSPAEGVHMSLATMGHLVVSSQARNVVGGLITGPVYGWLGHSWRVRRSLLSALLAALPLMLEPAALLVTGQAWGPAAAYTAEAIAGIALAAYFMTMMSRSRRPPLSAA